MEKTKPGKPYVVGQASAVKVQIVWEPPEELWKDYSFVVRSKEDKPSSKWQNHPESWRQCTATIKNLNPSSLYEFQVRMINDDGEESPFSAKSNPVEIIPPATQQVLQMTRDVKGPDSKMPLKKLILTENMAARDENRKTRKLVLGTEQDRHTKQKTIMIVGATGTGKSTLVDGMINYILGVSWSDPYRITLVDLEADEQNESRNQAKSQTQWITCYKITPIQGSRLNYTLNIIDTPGFGDTRGIGQDKKIIEQVETLFSSKNQKGITSIDAICFIVKAPDARLTPTQIYIFDSILSLFGINIKDNICYLITFADGQTPPVLAALNDAKMPCEQYLTFNNSGLFVGNEESNSLSHMFWEMGLKSFENFFKKLNTLETKSLQQTNDVLDKRKQLEENVDFLYGTLELGMTTLENLRKTIKQVEQNKREIDLNKNFMISRPVETQIKIPLPPGQFLTNCLFCHMTCHKECTIRDDDDKIRCWAIDKSTGLCTRCPKKCHWSEHKNQGDIYEIVTEFIQTTSEEMYQTYKRAGDDKMDAEILAKRMKEEVAQHEQNIFESMTKINDANNELRKIALKPESLSLVEHVKILIQTEKREKRPGFLERVKSLETCIKKATIGEQVKVFKEQVTKI